MSNLIERRQLMLDELAREFDVEQFVLRFRDKQFDFWKPADPDSLFDQQVIETPHNELEWQPYWAQVWLAAVGLCHELMDLDLEGQQVLDLGCGLGITGAVAASQGAQVILADNAPPALLFAGLNCLNWSDNTEVMNVNWLKDELAVRFDLILGADIIYDRNDLVHLDRFWRKHLAETGVVLLTEPSRLMSKDLIAGLEELGWKIARNIRRREVEFEEQVRTVNCFELRAN